MPIKPKSLAQVAESSGFSMADVAFLAGLEESTVCRLWDDPNWLDRIKGRSLQAIVKVVPGVHEYIAAYSLADRRNQLANDLSRSNIKIDQSVFKHLVRELHIPEQYLSNALQTAVCILNGDVRKSAAHLVRFWGRDQDFALGFVFGNVPENKLLVNEQPLITRSIEIVQQLAERRNSFHAIIAQANLIHHVTRYTGSILGEINPSGITRQNALAFRSSVIGKIMSTNDMDLAARYSCTVDSSPLMSMVEDWAFPTYTHDAKPTPDFSLPRSLLLQETANEVLREIDTYNEAYLFYLAHTSIPMILHRDPTFGLKTKELAAKISTRLDGTTDKLARQACASVLCKLQRDGSKREADPFDSAW
jgi:hypothetical protein